jgi:hypothetical protein
VITDNDIAYCIVDTSKRFHDRVVAEIEFPIGRGVHPDRAVDHGMFASMLIERC